MKVIWGFRNFSDLNVSTSNLLSGFLYLRAICKSLSFHASSVLERADRSDEFRGFRDAVHLPPFEGVWGTRSLPGAVAAGLPSSCSPCRRSSCSEYAPAAFPSLCPDRPESLVSPKNRVKMAVQSSCGAWSSFAPTILGWGLFFAFQTFVVCSARVSFLCALEPMTSSH